MLMRVREAMQDKTATKLSGHVEVDESMIGGKSRNMHHARREQMKAAGFEKAIALGMVEQACHGFNSWAKAIYNPRTVGRDWYLRTCRFTDSRNAQGLDAGR